MQEVTFQSLDTNGNAILDSDELEPHMLYETVRTPQHSSTQRSASPSSAFYCTVLSR